MVQSDIATYKEEVQTMIARKILDDVRLGAMTDSVARELAGFTLDSLENVSSNEQLKTFLIQVKQRWPICEQIASHMEQKITEGVQTDGAIKQVQEQLATL